MDGRPYDGGVDEPQIDRTTLGVLDVLLDGFERNIDVHGWLIMKALGRSGPAVYRSLDRLEEWGWVESRWETLAPGEDRPRKRYYRIVADRVEAARSRVRAQSRPAPSRLRPRFGLMTRRLAAR